MQHIHSYSMFNQKTVLALFEIDKSTKQTLKCVFYVERKLILSLFSGMSSLVLIRVSTIPYLGTFTDTYFEHNSKAVFRVLYLTRLKSP